jgi:hypothetical protein
MKRRREQVIIETCDYPQRIRRMSTLDHLPGCRRQPFVAADDLKDELAKATRPVQEGRCDCDVRPRDKRDQGTVVVGS